MAKIELTYADIDNIIAFLDVCSVVKIFCKKSQIEANELVKKLKSLKKGGDPMPPKKKTLKGKKPKDKPCP